MGKKRLVYGVGYNDSKEVTVTIIKHHCEVTGKLVGKKLLKCPFYSRWKDMLKRCYSGKYPSYEDVVVCQEWLTFSNFKVWMEKQDWEGKQLDKDLLFIGNKLYSPSTCLFVSRDVNLFITESDKARGEFPIGVTFDKATGKFLSQCRNLICTGSGHIGRYLTPEEAGRAWLVRKLELAKLLAAEQDDPIVAEALVRRYENYEISQI